MYESELLVFDILSNTWSAYLHNDFSGNHFEFYGVTNISIHFELGIRY